MERGEAGEHDPLPPLLPVSEIQERLALIFPPSFPDRSLLVGIVAARVVFVFLYGGFIEGRGRFLRPSYVYLFTKPQADMTSEAARREWLQAVPSAGFRMPGVRWYADN